MKPAEGEHVDIRGVGRCVVVSTSDPSVVTLQRLGGATLKIGQKALRERICGHGDNASTSTISERGERHEQPDQ